MQRAAAALARREHSRAELKRKLVRTPAPEESERDIDAALDALAAKGMLSEARFVAARVRARGERYGAARIRRELQQHELDPALVRDALAPLAGSEFERALAIWQRRFGTAAADAGERARQARFLSARGFSTEVVLRVLRQSRQDG